MIPADKPEFLRTLNGLAAIKPGAKITTEGLDIWWLSMADWTLTDFRAAAADLAKRSQFMPNPYDFEQLRKAGKPTAGEAWIKARQAIRNATWSDIESTGFSCGDPLTDQAVHAIGGYRAIGMCDSDKLHFLERRFAEHFASMSDAQDVREAVPQIATDRQKLSGPQRAVLRIEETFATRRCTAPEALMATIESYP